MHVPSLALQTPLSRTSVCLMPTSAWPAGILHRWAHGWLVCARLHPLRIPCWAFELSQRATTEASISVMSSWFCVDLRWESWTRTENWSRSLTVSQPENVEDVHYVSSTLLSLLESTLLVAFLQSCFFQWTKSQVQVFPQRHKEGESMKERSGENQILTCLPLQ